MPGGLAVSLLTTQTDYTTAISLGSLGVDQKLGEDVGPGTQLGNHISCEAEALGNHGFSS